MHVTSSLSTRLAFFANGIAMSAWAPLVPYAKTRLQLTPAHLGMVLLCLGIGSMLAMPATGALTARPVSGLDPGLGLVEVRADRTAWSPAPGRHTGWPEARARGQMALGWELAGCARAMLELAGRHALERVQFGRPIASFQAVRHRLAETLVAVEAAEAVLESAEVDGGTELAAVAKAVAGRSARVAARHSQQVLAGIGFTADHPFHRHLRRTLVCDQLLGSARALTEDLGARMISGGRLPAPLPL